MSDERYIVSLRRQKLDEAPEDWRELVSGVSGVSIVGAPNKRSITITGPEGLKETINELVGEFAITEKVVYYTQDPVIDNIDPFKPAAAVDEIDAESGCHTQEGSMEK